MKYLFALGVVSFLAVSAGAAPRFITLDGKPVDAGNPPDATGHIRKVEKPVLRIMPTDITPSKGTILVLPGGGYGVLAIFKEGWDTAAFFNQQGFDAAVLEYQVAAGPPTRDLALSNTLASVRLLRRDGAALGVNAKRLGLLGYSAGGHLAARTTQELGADEQPDDVMLIYPAYLQEKRAGTVIPAVSPPLAPRGRLFALIAANDNKEWVSSCQEYAKTWRGYDAPATLQVLPDGGHGFGMGTNRVGAAKDWPDLLAKFLQEPPTAPQEPNPAAQPVQQRGTAARHDQKVALAKQGGFDLVMIGDSITHNFEKPEFQGVWNQFFAPRHALNLGYSGARTENILWNLQHGELDGVAPKVVTLMLGTNNADEKNYPTRHTAGQIAGGIESIVRLLRERLPQTKILLLRTFPGCYGGAEPTSHRAILDRASDHVTRLADGEHIFYCDVNHVFLDLDGRIRQELMPDWLHPNAEGALQWARAMEPILSELMGDASRDTNPCPNSAIVPISKLENDSYDWWARHAEILKLRATMNPEIVLIGDSITHFWGGEPRSKLERGAKTWASFFGDRRVLNLGFGWDRTQNVLWRLDHGELDGLHPKTIVLHIGTNNTSPGHARPNTPAEIVEGIREICGRLRAKTPGSRILLMAIFPREEQPDHPRRKAISETNQRLADFARHSGIEFVDIGPRMTRSDGSISREILSDFCHPTEAGYQIWAGALREKGL